MGKRNLARCLIGVLATAAIGLGGCASSEKAVIPAGTMLVATLNEPLSTDYHRAGDPFLATIREPLQLDDKTVIAAGATVRGEITSVEAGTAGGNPPSLTLLCNEIALASGHMLSISTSPVVIEGTPLASADPAAPEDPAAATSAANPAAPASPAASTEPAAPSHAASAPEASATQPVSGTNPDMPAMAPAGQLTLSPGHEIHIQIVAPAEVIIAAS